MKIIRLWPVPVLLFCFYCLYALVVDSYEVLYKKRNETEPFQFFGCVELIDLFPDKTEIDLKELRDELYDQFHSLDDSVFGLIKEPIRFEELILNRTNSGCYRVFNRRLCLIANDQDELVDIEMFLSPSYEVVIFAIQSDTFDFVRMESSIEQIDQLTVRKKGRPYSDCDQSNGRFLCLNECFRERFRLSRYFYHSNETGHILLHFSESNRTIQKSERACFDKCKRENCKLFQMILVSNSKEPNTFEAESVLSTFDFWLQITGLIFSFAGLFFDQFASTATKLTKKLTRSRMRRGKVKIGLFYLNLTIIILSLAYCGYLGVRVALDQQAEAIDLPEKSRNLIQPKTVHLAVCFMDYVKDIYGKTLSEIEMETRKFVDNVLKDIYVTYGERTFRTDYLIHRKILLKWAPPYLGRCFPLSIYPSYQMLPSRPKLAIKLKKKVLNSRLYELYLLSEEENLSSKSFHYHRWWAFQKRIVKRLKSKGRCVNYKAKYVNCTGRQNCVERCTSRKFIRRYNVATIGTYNYPQMIDRDWFSSSEWNTSRPIEIRQFSIQESIYLNVSRECETEIPDEKECYETKFERTVRIEEPYGLTREIDLQFEVVLSVEELPSSLRMALDLLGIQSIFFGFTLLKLFWVVYEFRRPKWRVRNDKAVWFLICLLASVGCSLNTVRMLDVIVNGELVPTEHYEMAERVQMPAMVFCLRIDQNLLDRNHQLTGNYLDKLTREMSAERTFKSIAYLNESNEWTPFDLRLVEWFFLLDMKCFRVQIEQVYNRNQFHFSDDTQTLRMNFKRRKENQLVHFMTRSNQTSEFSQTAYLDYSERFEYHITHEASLYKHEDRFGFFRRYFPPLQEGEVDYLHGELLELQSNEPNRRTLSLPVEKEHFGLKVDEEHFEQLYWSKKQKNPNKRTNLNYRQLFVTNHLKKDRHSDFDFSLTLLFLQRVVHFTNEVNYATLMLSLLNLLSLWLELSVLDLPSSLVRLHDLLLVPLYLFLPVHLLRKLIKALLVCSRWLKKLRPKLYNLINPNPPVDSTASDQTTATSVT